MKWIPRFEKEVVTDNLTLLNNLVYILISNSHDREIDKFMQSIFIENEDIFKATYQMKWNNYPFQNTKVYKENFLKYLSDMKSQNDDDGLKKALDHFSHMELIERWNFDIKKIVDMLNKFIDDDNFDIVLSYFIDKLLFDIIVSDQSDIFNELLQEYSNNVLVKNLNKSLNGISFVGRAMGSFPSATFFSFKIEHYTVSLCLFDNEYIEILFWSRYYENIFINFISVTDISSYFKDLKSKFVESDVKIIKGNLYAILRHNEVANMNDIQTFLGVYRTGTYSDIIRWGLFPFINIASNPSILSKIIVQYGHYYTKTRYMNIRINRNRNVFEQMSLKSFDNELICPPVKLLAYHFMKEPYNQKLLVTIQPPYKLFILQKTPKPKIQYTMTSS